MLKIGDRVKLNGCPFDQQIPEEIIKFYEMKDKIQIVKKTKKVTDPGTTGQWIKTNLIKDWIDKAWFKRCK